MRTIEKIIQSSTTPLRQDVVWIDTSDPNNPVVKIYVNGKWEISQPGGGSEDHVTVKSLTKDEYDALEEKDKDTLYIVKNDPTNGHEWVDLGMVDDDGYHIVLATKNIGAENPWDAGKYFAWADTVGYYANEGHEFSLENTPYWDSENEEYTKYNQEDGLTELQHEEDDAAHVQWHGLWQIPNHGTLLKISDFLGIEDVVEIGNQKCAKWDSNQSILYIPISGYIQGTEIAGVNNEFDSWSSSITRNSGGGAADYWLLDTSDTSSIIDNIGRENGNTIRPIIKVKDLSELDITYNIYIGETSIVDNSSKVSDYDKSILDPGEEQYAYGVLIDFTQGKSSYDLTRIGNMDLHRELPVQSQYKGCIWDLETQSIVTYLNPENWNLATEDKTAEEIDELLHDGTKSIRVETPKFYACSKVLATDGAGNTTMAKIMFSTQKLNPWYIEIPKMVTDFRGCRLSEDGWPSSSLDVNDYLYGGYHTTKNAILTGKLNLLHPSTNIDRTTMREYCSTVNTHIFSYDAYKWILYWAVVIEYATLFTAKPMIQELDSNGFHQGGLGPGMTSIESYGAKYSDDSYIYNEDYDIQDTFFLGANYYQSNASDEFPLRDIGVTNNWGNRTGENIVEYTRNGKTSHVHQNRYRGFEFPFGDIQMNLDGFLGYTFKNDDDVSIAEAYFTCSNPEEFKDELPSEYDANDFDKGWRLALWNDKLDSFHREGYDEGAARAMCIGNNGDLFATKWFVGQDYKFDKYFVNYNYPPDGAQNTTLRVGSSAGNFGLDGVGLGCLYAVYGVGGADGSLGFRCFNIIQD